MAEAADYEDYMYDTSGEAAPPKSSEDWRERREFIRKQGQIGGIFLSEAAVLELKQFYKEYAKAISNPDLENIVTEVYVSSKRTLDVMLDIARRDLGSRPDEVQDSTGPRTPETT